MIISIPEDIYRYEAKTFGNFTARQVVCFFLALAVMAPVLLLLYWATGVIDLAALAAVLLGLPVLLCGFVKVDGQPLERVLLYKLRWRRQPHKRPYRAGNLYTRFEKEASQLEAMEQQAEKEAAEEAPARRRPVGKK